MSGWGQCFDTVGWGGGGRSGVVGGRSPGCFWVLPKRSISKPDPHG